MELLRKAYLGKKLKRCWNSCSLWRLEKSKLPSELMKCTSKFSKICYLLFMWLHFLWESHLIFCPISMCFPMLSSPFADWKGQIIGLTSGLGVEETCITLGRGLKNPQRALQLTSPLWCTGRHMYLHDVGRLSSLLGICFPGGPCDACRLCRSEKSLSFWDLDVTTAMPSLTWPMQFYFVLIIKVMLIHWRKIQQYTK